MTFTRQQEMGSARRGWPHFSAASEVYPIMRGWERTSGIHTSHHSAQKNAS